MLPAMRRRHPTIPKTQLRDGRCDPRATLVHLILSKNVIHRSTPTSTNGVSCQFNRLEAVGVDGVIVALVAVDYRGRYQ